MFSLCIPTMDRFDFLNRFLPHYCENPLITEIIISDENGNDTKQIEKNRATYGVNHIKISCFVNEKRLGPFYNKLAALNRCKVNSADLGRCEGKSVFIALIDSDNFADLNYFSTAKNYIEKNNLSENFVLMPSFAKPRFSYKSVPEVFSLFEPSEQYMVCFNTGNYILARDVFQNLKLNKDKNIIDHSSACDVILFNTLLLEQKQTRFFIVPELEYEHTVHDGSIYLQTYNREKVYSELVYSRFKSLFCHRIPFDLFYCKNKDTYPPFKNGLYLEEYFLKRFFELKIPTKRKYIPSLWTNFQIEGWFGSKKGEMQQQLHNWVKNYKAEGYFTVIQYDDAALLQLPPNTLIYGACSGDIPIPLIYEDKNNTLLLKPRKTFEEKSILCSFVGSMTSNGVQPNVREEMKKVLSHSTFSKHLHFSEGWTPAVSEKNKNLFVEITSDSKFALAPRGYGRSSFRFFEILQLGVIPIYVWNDKIWLPFYDMNLKTLTLNSMNTAVELDGVCQKINYDEFCIIIHVYELAQLEQRLSIITSVQYEAMLENYKKYQHLFTLEGMTQEILAQNRF